MYRQSGSLVLYGKEKDIPADERVLTDSHAYNDTAPHACCQADLRVPSVAIGFEPEVRMTGRHDHLENITRQIQLGKCLLQTLGL